jgi:hypothetical protein
MVSFDFWLAMFIVWVGALVLLVTSFKFLRKPELKNKIVGLGLICISIALLLNGIFYLFYLFTKVYWLFVEIFHIVGAILITFGILGFEKSRSEKNVNKRVRK